MRTEPGDGWMRSLNAIIKFGSRHDDRATPSTASPCSPPDTRRFVPLRRSILQAAGAALAAGCGLAVASRSPAGTGRKIRWLAFYGVTADQQTLSGYDIVILDPEFQGSVPKLAASGTAVLAYLSLGEIRAASPYFAEVDATSLLGENPDWPGTFRVDIRHPSWRRLVLDRIIPDMQACGFTGLLYDTLDTPPYLEQCDPIRMRGATQAAVDLVRSIRVANPKLMTLMNRGYALLPSVVDFIDGVVAESLMTRFDAQAPGGYQWNQTSAVALQTALLGPARAHRPPLPVLSLDYWNPNDYLTIRDIYARERALGFHPYVATPLLDQIVVEPA